MKLIMKITPKMMKSAAVPMRRYFTGNNLMNLEPSITPIPVTRMNASIMPPKTITGEENCVANAIDAILVLSPNSISDTNENAVNNLQCLFSLFVFSFSLRINSSKPNSMNTKPEASVIHFKGKKLIKIDLVRTLTPFTNRKANNAPEKTEIAEC